jgi:hypothetical protein
MRFYEGYLRGCRILLFCPLLNSEVIKMLVETDADPKLCWDSFVKAFWWTWEEVDVKKELFYVTKLFLEYNVHVAHAEVIRRKIVGFPREDVAEIERLLQARTSRPTVAERRLPFN